MLEVFSEIEESRLLNSADFNLRDQPVIVLFWTSSRQSSLRELEIFGKLDEALSGNGMQIVGVHTPEFEFGKDPGHIDSITRSLNIRFPVVLDPDYHIWAYFNNLYWPAKYIFDESGELIGEYPGEDEHEEFLSEVNSITGLSLSLEELDMKASSVRAAKDIHLGTIRGDVQNPLEKKGKDLKFSKCSGNLVENKACLEGLWGISDEYIESRSSESIINLMFSGRHLSSILWNSGHMELQYEIDGKSANIMISNPGEYVLFTSEVEGEHWIRISIPENARCYAFTVA